jgi:2-keto-4-pentenoate hydratase/2-oxohepta-3-ene-1,7-dioic acid hydratase in catechol pathway
MRLTTFISGSKTSAGIFHNGGYYDFADLTGDTDVLSFIKKYENQTYPDLLSIIKEKNLSGVNADRLCAPIPIPLRSIICIGLNYKDHAEELSDAGLAGIDTSKPSYFAKMVSPVMGNGDEISLNSHFTSCVDYEVELAVIIGKTLKCAAPAQAEDAVFGYTVLNDITARDIQSRYGQWFLGKSLDGFCSMGPYIVTGDELEPDNLNISCRVNGITKQNSNTSNFIHSIPLVISELSQAMTLFPGDIIATGTPGGIGHAQIPPCYLKDGDKVECEIEGIGILENIFRGKL